MKNIDSKTLFLSGIIVLCSSFLLFHIVPYQIVDKDFGLWIQSFVHVLLRKPVATIGITTGTILIYNAIKK